MQSTPMATSSPQSPHLLRRPQRRIASTNAHTEIPRRATVASSAKLEVVAAGIKEEEILESNCWRSDHRTLRAEIRGLRSEVAQLRMQDSLQVPELQRLVDGVLRDLNLDSDEEEEEEVGIVVAADWGQQEWDSGNAVEEQFRGSIISPIPHSEELHVKQKEEGLSTGRRLKKLKVHDYVHGALRESHMRTWLQNRGIAE